MAKPIMIVGTMTNSGKSWLATGLCRVFHQDGKTVAPFKAQNLASNSFTTSDGAEIGRAQAIQAEAAEIEPLGIMNPVLLKPASNGGKEVIINGKAVGTMTDTQYYLYEDKNLQPIVENAYERLAAAYDIVVLEGAGSPAEVNPNEHDLVNMGMAKLAKAPVLLLADISRGGVFATICGTLMLMSDEERQMIKGIVINKFRGDVESLKPGLRMIEEKTGIPVLGVIPMANIDIEDEDSLSERLQSTDVEKVIDVAVIALPHISNYTDFNVFEMIPGVALRYIRKESDLGDPDMIIIPGTKNTLGDLKWMRANGLEAAVLKKAQAGTVIFGVCGGYQIMGEKLSDPYGVEEGGVIQGMGLLHTMTMFAERSRTFRVDGCFGDVKGVFHQLKGKNFYGYEIHSGITDYPPETSFTLMKPTYEAGEIVPEGSQHVGDGMMVYGTNIHGIFDCQGVADTIVKALLRQKGMKPTDMQSVNYNRYKQVQYDKLADCLRQCLDMERIYAILEEGI